MWHRIVLILLLMDLPLLILPIDGGCDENHDGYLFPHPETSRFWFSGQANVIRQWHGPFPARYSGVNSLRPARESATSRVFTLYTGFEVTPGTELLLDVESAAGRGISDAFGLAGFTNLDVVRNPSLGARPYLARLMVRRVFALSDDEIESPRGPLSALRRRPARRLEVRAGKLGIADFFDLNAVGSDSHLQFTNWTVDNNGGYDYAADTRGYTVGAIVEYQDRAWGARAAVALMPKIANGIDLDWDVGRARGENVEVERRHAILHAHTGVVRVLAYANHANMGRYREAITAFLAGRDPEPDIEAHRRHGRVKYGVGVNVEQEMGGGARLFGRGGWNEGRNESFAYTEVNSTIAAGADEQGRPWRRPNDRLGVAVVSNGISRDHQAYLALGGHGFLLGDGALAYGRETIVEAYYTAAAGHGLFGSIGLQRIWNPGYNRDRGPVLVPMLRAHVEF